MPLCVDCNSTNHSSEYVQLPVDHEPFIKISHKFRMATTSFLFITNYGRWRFSSFLTLLRTMTRSRVTTSKVICSTCRKGHVEIMTEVTVSGVDTGCSSFDWSKPPEAEVCDFSSICPCCVPCSQRTVSSRSL